jgi:hypothetical protein
MMPLKGGWSRQAISDNISYEMRKGSAQSHDQAIAIALSHARRQLLKARAAYRKKHPQGRFPKRLSPEHIDLEYGRNQADIQKLLSQQVDALEEEQLWDTKIHLIDPSEEDLQELSVWYDQAIEGRAGEKDLPASMRIIKEVPCRDPESYHTITEKDIITNVGEMLGEWLDGDFQHVLQYTGRDELDDKHPHLRWADLDRSRSGIKNQPWDELFYVPPSLSYGDYDHSTAVERSNHDVFLEKFDEVLGVYTVSGGYGSNAVAIKLTTVNEEMLETLGALQDYPVISEEAWSAREQEMFEEAYETWGRGEFIRGLEKSLGIDILGYNEGELDDLFWRISGEQPSGPIVEAGGNVHFPYMADIVAEVTLEDLEEIDVDFMGEEP